MHIHILGGMYMQNTNEGISICTYDNQILKTKEKTRNEWKDKFYTNMIKHKFISLIIFAFVILSTINGIMVYNFFKILQNI